MPKDDNMMKRIVACSPTGSCQKIKAYLSQKSIEINLKKFQGIFVTSLI